MVDVKRPARTCGPLKLVSDESSVQHVAVVFRDLEIPAQAGSPEEKEQADTAKDDSDECGHGEGEVDDFRPNPCGVVDRNQTAGACAEEDAGEEQD